MKVDIIIPSCKDRSECEQQIRDIERTRTTEGKVIFTGLKASASVNRNRGIDLSDADILIQCDDDTTGFFPGWDEILIKPLIEKDNVSIVAARLLNVNGTIGFMMGDPKKCLLDGDIVETSEPRLATACVAFKFDPSIRFDENFLGSGYDDTDFNNQYLQKYPDMKFVINNKCRIIHINEMKNQKNRAQGCDQDYWTHNKTYFLKKWGEKDIWHD